MRRLVTLAGAMCAVLAVAFAPGAARPVSATDPGLAQFVRDFGDPPSADFGRIRIDSIGVDAPLGVRDVAADGFMPMPLGPSDVAWYDFAAVPGYGGTPGAGWNAVFSGHVDYVARVPWAGTRYAGTGVFYRLGEVQAGDVIEVDRPGGTLRYVVTWVRQVPADDESWGELLQARVPIDSITLFTCGGEFDARVLEYSHRTVVRAESITRTGNQLPQTFGDYTAGTAGTTSPFGLAASQTFPVFAIWKEDPTVSGGYRFWAPNVPAFLDTLSGHLRDEDWVILRIRPTS
ncbi:MAG: class F sortase [Dehalococcoidia bacterium]